MRPQELSEVRRRAALVASGAIDALESELRALHARNAAKGSLRSGATIKESARIAGEIVRQYFGRIEAYVRELPGGGTGSDVAVIDSVSESTRQLVEALWTNLRKTAALASDEKLVAHIQPEVEAALVTAQEEFRSNLRAFWAQRTAAKPREPRWLLIAEVALLAVALIFAALWVRDPAGSHEAWAGLFALLAGGVDLYRRNGRAAAP